MLFYVKWLVFIIVASIGVGMFAEVIRRRVLYMRLGQAGDPVSKRSVRTMQALGQILSEGKL